MAILIVVVSVAVLCVTHYSAFRSGAKLEGSLWFHKLYLPLVRRHNRVVDRVLQATVDDNASAQQKNVLLVMQNAVLRGKAIHYARAYGRLRRQRSPRSRLYQMATIVTMWAGVQDQLDRSRKQLRTK